MKLANYYGADLLDEGRNNDGTSINEWIVWLVFGTQFDTVERLSARFVSNKAMNLVRSELVDGYSVVRWFTS